MKLSHLQVELLKLLFEAGGENVPTVANTMYSNFRWTSRADYLAHLDDELEQLRQLGLVGLMYYLADPQPSWRYLTEEELRRVTPAGGCLEWDESGICWRWNEKKCGTERVVVVIQEAGRELLVEGERL